MWGSFLLQTQGAVLSVACRARGRRMAPRSPSPASANTLVSLSPALSLALALSLSGQCSTNRRGEAADLSLSRCANREPLGPFARDEAGGSIAEPRTHRLQRPVAGHHTCRPIHHLGPLGSSSSQHRRTPELVLQNSELHEPSLVEASNREILAPESQQPCIRGIQPATPCH